MIIVIDYKIGNLLSIKKMIERAGGEVKISSSLDDIMNAEKLILPGVGSFDYGMNQLKNSNLIEALNEKVINQKTPILGICLGAQLMTNESEEGDMKGLGWVDASTVRFNLNNFPNLKVPNMGWLDVEVKKNHKLFKNLKQNSRFYFVHTYHFECFNIPDVVVEAKYGYNFSAGFINGNIIGLQFHPEKSHKFGLQLMKNFVKYY